MKLKNQTLSISVLMLMLAACATPATTRIYTLANPSNPLVAVAPISTGATTIAIEVLPINVPERLKRPQIVLSTQGSTQLKILEQDRWSSSFNDELRDAMASGIAGQIGAADVSRGGRVAGQPVYRVAIALRQFNAAPGDKVLSNFGWTVTRLANASSPGVEGSIACQSAISKTVGNTVDEVVKGLQVSVEEIAQQISASIVGMNNGGAGECRH